MRLEAWLFIGAGALLTVIYAWMFHVAFGGSSIPWRKGYLRNPWCGQVRSPLSRPIPVGQTTEGIPVYRVSDLGWDRSSPPPPPAPPPRRGFWANAPYWPPPPPPVS